MMSNEATIVKVNVNANTPLTSEPHTCAICYDDITDLLCELPCKHRYHSSCYSEYMAYEIRANNKNVVLCPQCRSVVLEISHEINFQESSLRRSSMQTLNLTGVYDETEVLTQPASAFVIKVALTWILIYLIVVISQCTYGKHNFICPK